MERGEMGEIGASPPDSGLESGENAPVRKFISVLLGESARERGETQPGDPALSPNKDRDILRRRDDGSAAAAASAFSASRFANH